jgi:RNA polymerase sigma factor (sigma-70 family)
MSPRISIRLLSAQSDERLLALAGEGHERAFEALVHRYRRPLLRYCRGMGLSETRAEDVLQQALLQAWLALSRGTDVRDLKPWLYRIVHNTAVNAMRGASERHGELTEAIHARAAVAGQSDLERKIAMRDALTDVAALPQMQRQAIFLTAVDGQSHDEVASALGISLGALRGLLYRARATLRSAAAALTPPPLIEWASRGSGAAGPTAERLAELTAGGGAAGMTGLLLKGAVVAVTAGAVASGAAVVDHHERARRAAEQAASAQLAGPSKSAGLAVSGVFSASLPVSHAPGGDGSADARHGAGTRHGASTRHAGRDHRGDGSARHNGREHSLEVATRQKPGDDEATRVDVTERHGGESTHKGNEADVADIKGNGTSGGTGAHGGKGLSGTGRSGGGADDSGGSTDRSSGDGGGSGSSSGSAGPGSEGSSGSAELSSAATSGGSSVAERGEQRGGATGAEPTTSGKGGPGSGSDG